MSKDRMTYEQYEKQFVSELLSRSEDSESYTRKFAETLIARGHVKKHYIDERNMSEMLGSNQINPGAFANNCVMLGLDESDFSDTVKVDENDNVFKGSMTFTGVR